MDLYAIIGGGGYGREIMPLARDQLSDQLKAKKAELIFADDCIEEPTVINGHKAVSIESLKATEHANKHFNIAIC